MKYYSLYIFQCVLQENRTLFFTTPISLYNRNGETFYFEKLDFLFISTCSSHHTVKINISKWPLKEKNCAHNYVELLVCAVFALIERKRFYLKVWPVFIKMMWIRFGWRVQGGKTHFPIVSVCLCCAEFGAKRRSMGSEFLTGA